MNTHLLKFAAVSLLVLAAGCSKDSDPKPLATPEPRFKAQSTVTEYSFFWNPIEHADTYSYKLEPLMVSSLRRMQHIPRHS